MIMTPGGAIFSAIGGSNKEERVALVLDALSSAGWAFFHISSPPLPEADGDFGPLDGEPDYPDMEEHEDEPLEEALREILTGGQGDDDGPQIMPDFEEGESVLSMVHACIALLETRRDVIEGYANTEAELRHRLAAREKAEQVAAGLRERVGKELDAGFSYGSFNITGADGTPFRHQPSKETEFVTKAEMQRVIDDLGSRIRAALRASAEEGKTATPSVKDEEAGK